MRVTNSIASIVEVLARRRSVGPNVCCVWGKHTDNVASPWLRRRKFEAKHVWGT